MSTSILSPTGQPMVMIGGERAWKQRTIRDIVCSFQWLDRPDIDPEGPHPCMILHRRDNTMDRGAYVIPQRNAYAYATPSGEPTPQLMASAFLATTQLGFHPDTSTVHRLIDIIVEGLADLVLMPSTQPGEFDLRKYGVHGIEATAKVNGKTIHQELI
jgi:hypothetical protein